MNPDLRPTTEQAFDSICEAIEARPTTRSTAISSGSATSHEL